jgi:hypothetical protein
VWLNWNLMNLKLQSIFYFDFIILLYSFSSTQWSRMWETRAQITTKNIIQFRPKFPIVFKKKWKILQYIVSIFWLKKRILVFKSTDIVTDIRYDINTNMLTLIIIWKNDTIRCNYKYRCRVGVRHQHFSDIGTRLIQGVSVLHSMWQYLTLPNYNRFFLYMVSHFLIG